MHAHNASVFCEQVAWNAIKSSLDACGEGTVFLEYSVNESSVGLVRSCGKVIGMVYAVKIQVCLLVTATALLIM